MPNLVRVLETGLYVDDMNRAVRFYRDVFELDMLFLDDRLCAFNVNGQSVLLLFLRGGSTKPMPLHGSILPPHDGTGQLHMAFAITKEELPAWEERLARHQIPIESRVNWPLGGRSIYFRDPDEHLLELATPGIWATY